MPLSHKPPKVVSHVSQKHPYSITSGDKAHITILVCANASGYSIPPMVVLDRKTLHSDMTTGEVPGTLSDSGKMDAELFEEWFKNHFLVHAPPSRPLMLLLDGHTSHYNLNVLQMASKEGIILFCLPPHSTHLHQPLDNGTFSALKAAWKRECHHFISTNPGRTLNRRNFSGIFHKAWIAMSNIIACFCMAGVYPVDRNAVLSQIKHASVDTSMHTPHSPSATPPFVPFCTPKDRIA